MLPEYSEDYWNIVKNDIFWVHFLPFWNIYLYFFVCEMFASNCSWQVQFVFVKTSPTQLHIFPSGLTLRTWNYKETFEMQCFVRDVFHWKGKQPDMHWFIFVPYLLFETLTRIKWNSNIWLQFHLFSYHKIYR